jgi:hypothetical protein
MDTLLKYWPVVVLVLGVLGAAGNSVVNTHLAADARRDQEIRELQGIILSEWPQYTKTIFWEGR